MTGETLPTNQLIEDSFQAHSETTQLTLSACKKEVSAVSSQLIDALENGKKVIFVGNGGSAADAQHLAAELVGRFTRERKSLAAIALTTDTSAITAIGNDYGYEYVFSRQIEGIANHGDVLIAISTSGNSANVIKAVETAFERGCVVVGMSGNTGGTLAEKSNMCITVPSKVTARIQEMHILIGHILCDIVEKHFYGLENDQQGAL